MKTTHILLSTVILMSLMVTNGQVVSFTMRKLAFSINQFGFDLYRAMDFPNNMDAAVCPFGVSLLLATMLLGARGNTEVALRQALYLWGMRSHETHAAFRDLLVHLRENLHAITGEKKDDPQSLANNSLIFFHSLYVQRDFSIHYPYLMYLQRLYNTTLHPIDFILNGPETKEHINAIVEKQTNGKIKDILLATPPHSTSLLVLSALYFRGIFDPAVFRETNRSRDYVGSRAILSSRADMKKTKVRYGKYDYLGCVAVEIPFRGGDMSFLALVPETAGGLGLLESRISAQRLNDILNTLEAQQINLKVPHIVIEQNHQNLTKALLDAGLTDLFMPGYANLYGISDFPWLHISNIIHKINIEIHQIDYRSSRQSNDLPTVQFKHPFLFFVLDNVSGLAIVMGKIAKSLG
ncbi:leukocyte elastase inhibitor-like [Centruroides vittatus]|uniref:leukocyte elastase inhibitor-like n=1 Tax=Centruroides vittatus TaxID=120091 RepID=UPI00350EA7C3